LYLYTSYTHAWSYSATKVCTGLKNVINHEYLLEMADLPVCYAVYAKQLLQHIESNVKVQYS